MKVTRFARIVLYGLLCCAVLGTAGVSADEQSPAPEVAPVAHAIVLPAAEDEVLPDLVEEAILETDPWVQQVIDLLDAMGRLEATAEDADRLFVELSPVVRERLELLDAAMESVDSATARIQVPGELGSQIATLEDLFLNVQRLYLARNDLMAHVSVDLYDEITGTKLFGAQELRTEAQFARTTLRYQIYGLPLAWDVIKQLLDRSPLRLFTNLLQIIVAFMLFSWWRRWFPGTLDSMRRSLMTIRPRDQASVRRLKLIWYIEQVRSPVEWLLLLHTLAALVSLDPVLFLKDVLFIFVRWILAARIIVLLINAVSARGDVGLSGDEANLRLRTLQLISGWLLILGIGVSLADYLTGEGAVHAWIIRVFGLLSIPLLIVLLTWWRKRIFDRLTLEPDESGRLAKMLAHQHGITGFFNAASGLGFLLASGLRRGMLRRIGAQDVLNEMVQNKLADAANSSTGEGRSATAALRREFLEPGELYARYARAERRSLVQRINNGPSGRVILTGCRGAGKSRFLHSLEDRIEGSLLYLDCQSGYAAEAIRAFPAALGFTAPAEPGPAELLERLQKRNIRVIAIDNVHRLIRPAVGGQRELETVLQYLGRIHFDGVWLYSADCYAWRYGTSAKAARNYADTVIELPTWSEEEIGELIDQRCEELGIDPDFSEVAIPRDFLDAVHNDMGMRNRAGVVRMLTEYSDGNPAVVLRLWSQCLVRRDDKTVAGSLPALGSTGELDQLVMDVQLVLRAIARFERISREEIQEGLRISASSVDSAVRLAAMRGWIEEEGGGLTLDWCWYPLINRILARQNLLTN